MFLPLFTVKAIVKAIWHASFTIRCILSVQVCFCLHNVANSQRIQLSNTRNLGSSFGAYDHHYIYLSQERLTPSWITACFISITPKYYILLPSLSPVSVLAAVLLRSSVVGHAMLSRHLILAGRGILLGKGKKIK